MTRSSNQPIQQNNKEKSADTVNNDTSQIESSLKNIASGNKQTVSSSVPSSNSKGPSNLPVIRVSTLKEAEDSIDKMYWGMCVLVRDLMEQSLSHHFITQCSFPSLTRDNSGNITEIATAEIIQCAVNSQLYKMFLAEFRRINVAALTVTERITVNAKCERALMYLKTRHLYQLIMASLKMGYE